MDESEIKIWFFFTMKQDVLGSKSVPLLTFVPGRVGLTKDFTNNGISFFWSGCKVLG